MTNNLEPTLRRLWSRSVRVCVFDSCVLGKGGKEGGKEERRGDRQTWCVCVCVCVYVCMRWTYL